MYLNQINEFLTVIIFFSLDLTTLQVFFSNVCRTHNYSSREMTLWSETHYARISDAALILVRRFVDGCAEITFLIHAQLQP